MEIAFLNIGGLMSMISILRRLLFSVAITLQVYYANLGRTKSSIRPGLRQPKTNVKGYSKVKYTELPIQFISVRNAMKPDPIFMSIVATYLIMIIGSYETLVLITKRLQRNYCNRMSI